ncbi:RAB6-interacting golgin [Nerophis lumbriciformis]|uniref:RAB6-interacting golgin n=1 Tax=Nerophis lumbriciformis TaxID=546530 RepID=UPI002ADFB6B8|nr:RAB6-interacting golgin [Nerophis lumbriciformis]
MSEWAGFSEDELRRMQHKESRLANARKSRPASRGLHQSHRERNLHRVADESAGLCSTGLPPDQQLNKVPSRDEAKMAPAAPTVKKEEMTHDKCREDVVEEPLPDVKELDKQQIQLRDQARLEQLQQEQKSMEEMNKRKKALLTKTIAEKSKQTQAEAVKLKRIQKELQTLDDMVSNDVCILRGRIDEASWDYATARKRYEKAETEYVTAKMDLHKKSEVKEQLTEHLFAIIQQNELRKAHKLEELMHQLQATEEELERQRAEDEKTSEPPRPQENGVTDNQETTAQSGPAQEEHQEEDGGVNVEHRLPDQTQPEQDFQTAQT